MNNIAKRISTIQTQRPILRGIGEEDTKEIVKWRSDPFVYRFFKNPHKITEEEHIRWYKDNYLKNPNRFDWMCIEKESGGKIGVFGIIKEEKTAEVNYLLAPEAQHKGYASESLKGIIQYAYDDLTVKLITAVIHKDNKPSIALVEKMGFTFKEMQGEFSAFQYQLSTGKNE